MLKSKGHFYFFALALLLIAGCPWAARAFRIEKVSGASASGDFVLEQAKTEVSLNPGDQAVRSISLLNRSGVDLSFSVSVEDFSASVKPDQNIDLLGDKIGLYSLKNYLKPEIFNFTLHQGERITLPVTISLPESVQPGGLYGAVIFSAQPASAPVKANSVQVVSRLASLFFVRVNGEVTENGQLQDFSGDKAFYWGGPLNFTFDYKNTGTVYLNPYGELKLADVFGRTAYSQWINPYFVLPGAVRQQKITVNQGNLWGLYQATLQLNRGYGNLIDQKSIYIFILPLPYAIAAAVLLLVLAWLAWRMSSAFKKPKQPNVQP